MAEIRIPRSMVSMMESHVSDCFPEEGCGLLAGKGNTVELTIPITNRLHSRVRYNMEPKELVKAFYRFDELEIEMLASFHSHPRGPAFPSFTDVQEFSVPGTYMLIWSFDKIFWKLDGFVIVGMEFTAIDLEFV